MKTNKFKKVSRVKKVLHTLMGHNIKFEPEVKKRFIGIFKFKLTNTTQSFRIISFRRNIKWPAYLHLKLIKNKIDKLHLNVYKKFTSEMTQRRVHIVC